MKSSVLLALWALQVIWGLKAIWPVDRLRLWRKSFNLYLAFLAFTDKERPYDQLRRAMVCAILSAVYDHDSDWIYGDRSGSNFRKLLDLIESDQARALASGLYAEDAGHQLSEHGLERGSVALRFYWLVIRSQWMRNYTIRQIDDFGRKLQIIDDLLDLEGDRIAGDTNCLLTDRVSDYIAEAEEFLESDFFKTLKSNSKVYRVLGKKVRKNLNNFGTKKVTSGHLWQTGRPTTGAYAFITVLISFGYYEGAPWAVRFLTATAFTGLTMSIMVFNDWVDRFHDRKKGKTFASEHSHELFRYWMGLSAVTAFFIGFVAVYDVWTAIFCVLVWLTGVLYSYIPRWYIIQNVVVAVCAGCPALCGLVYHGQATTGSITTFLMFSSLLFISEIYKDIEDAKVDLGYKVTMPIVLGHRLTVLRLFALCFLPATVMVFHPNPWIWKVALVGLPLLQFDNAMLFQHPQVIARPKSTLRWILKVLLIVLLFT